MRIFNYQFQTNQKNSLKIFVISDIHLYYQKDIKKLMRIDQKISHVKNLDALFIDGDIIDESIVLNDTYIQNELIKYLKKWASNMNIFITLGNHDLGFQKSKIWQEDNLIFTNLLDILKSNPNIHFQNQIYPLKNGYTVTIINPSLKYAFNTKTFDKNDYSFLNKLNNNDTNILICHYPSIIFQLLQNNLLNNISTCICGHNHNGCTQLRFFPLEKILNKLKKNNVGIITPSKSFKRSENQMDRGLIKLNDKTTLIINPAITTLSHKTKLLHYFNFLFYEGITFIKYN